MKLRTLLITVFLLPLQFCSGHIRLVFPPARTPALDFLDSARSIGPCGVSKPPEGKGTRTSLLSGSSFNVSWFMSYPHQGGFRIELLNEAEVPILVLTPPESTYTGSFDQTAESFRVQLPLDMQCYNCAIRLLRQAQEWSNDYRFWSCADVNIIKDPGVGERCSNQGAYVDGRCRCNRLFHGEFCQFKDECWADHECGINGKCQELAGQRVCYCKMGWFGRKCNQAFPFLKSSLDTGLYQSRVVGPDNNKIHWRIIQESNELEVVLQYPGRSWVALGWKPQRVNPQCTKLGIKDWPVFSSHPEPEPQPERQPYPEIDPVHIDHVHPEPEVTPEQFVPFILPNLPTKGPAQTPLPDIIVDSEPIQVHPALPVVPEPEPEPEISAPTTSSPAPPPISTPLQPRTEEIPIVPVIVDIPGGPPPLPDSFPIPDPPGTTLPESSEPEEQPWLSTPPAPPLESSNLDYDPNGVEINPGPIEIQPIFIRPNQSVQPPPFVNESPDFTPSPPAPIPDVLEEQSQLVGDDCYGDWRWPAGCRDCDYLVSWSYVDESDEVEFSIETRASANWWTGLGFSPSGSMADADMVIVKSQEGQLTLHDLNSNGYGVPSEDTSQDVYTPSVVGSHINGVLRASFTRKRDTRDTNDDLRFSDSECYYFLFPVNGGKLDSNGDIRKHMSIPHVSEHKICIKSCLGPAVQEAPVEPPVCTDSFSYPVGCIGNECDYAAKWMYNDISEDVMFEISSREIGRWTGIGFSKDGKMANSDIYTGWVYDDQAYVTDRFAYGPQLPPIDSRQDIFDIGGKVEEDIQTIWFKRKVLTDDTLTDYPLNKCYYFLFPVGGGIVLARKTEDFQDPSTPIGYHDQLPIVSKEKICLCSADGQAISIRKKRQVQNLYSDSVVQDNQLNPFAHPEPFPEGSHDHHGHNHAGHDHHGHNHADHAHGEPYPQGESHAHPKSEPHPEHEPHAHPHPEPEGSLLHPMDCSDIIMGSAIGTLSRVEDMYTVSRATPMVDEDYDGQQSVTAATGWEEDGITTIMFRRKLHATDRADHSIINEPMTVIWAKGQEFGSYAHSAPSALENGHVSNSNFYSTDVLKYHGSQNRGSFIVNFYDKAADRSSEICRGSFSFPSGCSGSQCDYSVQWSRDIKGVHFTLDSRIAYGHWTGIGFSKDGLMSNADMVLVSVKANGEIEITDRYSGSYQRPVVDSSQNIYNIHGKYMDGRLSAQFSRDLTTDDSAEDADLNQCQYFLYPQAGGPVMDGTDLIRKHIMTPVVSSVPVCLQKCTDGTPPVDNYPKKDQGHKTGEAAFVVDEQSKYLLSFRIMNEAWNHKLVDPSNKRFQKLSRRVVQGVGELLQPLNGYSKSHVLQYRASPSNEVIADIELAASGHKELEIVNAIQYPVSAGIVQGLEIDPGSVHVSRLANDPTPEQVRNYIIIGVAAFLILVAVVLAICLLARAKKNRTNEYNGFPGAYPGGAYPYHPGSMPEKGGKGGFEPAYDPRGYPGASMMSHSRQYSNATTATPNGKTPSPTTDTKDPTNSPPDGAGETTYADWFSRVASHPGSSQHLESGDVQGRRPSTSTMPREPRGPPKNVPYISYPNDPYNYYTLNGRGAAAAPSNYGTANRQMYYRRDPY